MADTKISALAAGAPAQATDLIPIARSGSNYSITPANILSYGTSPITGTTVTSSTGSAVGGATAGAGGVAFPATAVAVSDANTLDDYEEGTWTPSLGGSTTYSTQSGTYTKIGRQVTVQFDLAVTLIGTGSATTISGLPFAVSGTAGGSVATFSTLATNVLGLWCYATSSIVTFQSLTAAGTSPTNQPSIFGNSSSIRGTLTYFV